MNLPIGFSPCPNDTFIFDALVHQKIDTLGIQFTPVLEDVQTLNEWALDAKLPISKISYGVWPLVKHSYQLLESGGALGKGVGPLLVAKQQLTTKELEKAPIAIPGKNTTAHVLFSMAYPNCKNKVFLPFHEIEAAVVAGTVLAGVIIHENRFTYAQKGLVQLADLGNIWEDKTQSPIPLGGIVASSTLPSSLISTIDTLIQTSVRYAFEHYPTIPDFVKQHAQEMDEQVMKQHIDLYVNNYSLALGTEGGKAVQLFEDAYLELAY